MTVLIHKFPCISIQACTIFKKCYDHFGSVGGAYWCESIRDSNWDLLDANLIELLQEYKRAIDPTFENK